MTYEEALSYLNSLRNYEQMTVYRYGEVFSLEPTRELLARLGNPQSRYAALHVAGTKGKGSTCAFAASILRAAGARVGLYTSPHFLSFRERIQVNGQPIPEEALAQMVSRIRSFVSPERTFFEVTTACALLYFAEARVDVAVVEVGLGGRLDATNVVEPRVIGITPISLDHMAQLGQEIRSIAREKAGIIKRNIPVVLSPQVPEAQGVVEETARVRGAFLHRVDEEVQALSVQAGRAGTRLTLRTPEGLYPDLEIPLVGRHQVMNAMTAVRMVELLAGPGEPLEVPVREGLSQTLWPGRCQIIEGAPDLLVDGAHNAASAQVLRNTIEELFPGRRVWLIFGTSQEKDLAGMAAVLGSAPGWRLILTKAQVARAESPERIAEAFRPWHPQPLVTGSVGKALDQARALADPKDLIVVTGSLFVAGETLQEVGAFSGSFCGAAAPETGFPR